MAGYSVRIIQPVIGGEYSVIVLRHEFPGSVGAVVARTGGIYTALRALTVSRDYREQFGCGSIGRGTQSADGAIMRPAEWSAAGHVERRHAEILLSLPVVNPDRPCLRDVVPYSAKTLERLARKFTTPAAYRTKAPKPQWWDETNKEPIYPAWTRSAAQATPLPFETGRTVLPGLEAWAKQHGII